ncbi:hypothetical protein [Clostridium beijerinckii]|uniref:hypothetical protein n=1 Tax=Clostridium beijerinckii TaxID=1520 RepID=UPI00030C16D4|nr:hypothetical protein [Clostridium beijerinckii]
MKKLKLTKLIASSLLIATIIILNPIGASAEWKQNDIGWWYTEGDSYSKGWKQIGGSWYYFGKYDGYMAYSTDVDGYYLNSSGAWSEGTKEIKAYMELLKNNSLLKSKYNLIISDEYLKKNYLLNAKFVDLNQDGIFEMIVTNGTSEADKSVAIFTYTDGNIKLIDNLHNSHTEYNGYNKDENVFLLRGGSMGEEWGLVYKLENGKCNLVYSYSCNSYTNKIILNGQKISNDEFNKFLNKFKN